MKLKYTTEAPSSTEIHQLPRDIKINFKVSKEEDAVLRQTAEDFGMTLSQYIRYAMCGEGIKIVRIGGKLFDVQNLRNAEEIELEIAGNDDGQNKDKSATKPTR